MAPAGSDERWRSICAACTALSYKGGSVSPISTADASSACVGDAGPGEPGVVGSERRGWGPDEDDVEAAAEAPRSASWP